MRSICSTIIDEDLASSIVAIGHATKGIEPLIQIIITDEIQKEVQVTALFRTDSMSTKMMRRFAIISGFNWLNLMVGDIIRRIVTSPGQFEVDPNKLPQGQILERNIESVKNNTNLLLESILSKLDTCPNEIRSICKFLYEEVEKKFEKSGNQALAGFIFLRFICPAIISPINSNIIEGTEISTDAQRHLILIAKIIQNIANNVVFGQKESYMMPFNNFVEINVEKVQNYLHDLAFGVSSNSIDLPKITSIEVLAEIDNLTEHLHKNIGLIEQKLPQNITQDWQASKQHIERYFAVMNLNKKERTKPRNKFCIFH